MRGPWWQPRIILVRQIGAQTRARPPMGRLSYHDGAGHLSWHPSGSTALVLGFIAHGTIVQFERREHCSQRPEIFRLYRNLEAFP